MGKKEFNKARKQLMEYKTDLLRELDALDHILEYSLKEYDTMIDFAIEKGFDAVVDIGCAFGHQSSLCEGRIKYIGMNEDEVNFYKMKPKKRIYSAEKYPCYIPFDLYKNDLAISHLAIGWQCYANDKETEKQFAALAEDFKASLLHLPVERKELLKKYFKNIETLREGDISGIYYCYNYN